MAKKKKSLADELLEEPLVKSNTTKSDTKKVSVANTPKQRVTSTFEDIAPIKKTQNNLMSRDEVLSPLNIGKQKKIIQTAMNREKPEDNSSFFGTTANVLKTFGQGMMKAEESIFIDTPSALISKAILGGSRATSRVASIFDDDLASKILIKGTQASNKLNEIAQDDWTANALDYYGWNKKLDNGKTVAETLESKSAITSNDILGKAVEGLGGMTPTILMGGLLGGSTAGVQTAQELEKVKKLQNVVSYSSLGARSFGGAYEQALQSGATPDQAMAYGISSASVEIGTEWLSGGVPGVKGTVGGGLDEAFGKYVLKEGVEETSKSLSKAITKSLYKTSMEGVEEMISETLEPYIKQFTYEYDESKSLGENFNEASKKVSFQDIMEAGVVGSLTAVLLGDVDISDMKTGYQNTQAINNTIANEIQNQQNMLGRELTKEESNAIKTEIKDHANNVNQYGEEIANRIIDVKNNNTSTEGLDLEQSYKAYNGEKKYTKEITNIQKFMNNRNIEARFDATMFDNNEQNAIWTTQDGKDAVIFNPNASADQVIQNIATHEMTHDIINQKTEAGTSLFNDVLENIKTQENYAKDRQEIEDLYAKYYDRNSEDFSAKVDEEMVANELGKNLGTQEYINRLVNEKPNLAKRIYNWVVDKLDNIGKSAEYKEQKKYWKSVADKFEVAYNEQKTATGEDKTAYSILKNKKEYNLGNYQYGLSKTDDSYKYNKVYAYDIENGGKGDNVQVSVTPTGYVWNNALLSDNIKGKGEGTKIALDLNQQSIEETGYPLRSLPEYNVVGTKNHTEEGKGLWESLVRKGYAVKNNDNSYTMLETAPTEQQTTTKYSLSPKGEIVDNNGNKANFKTTDAQNNNNLMVMQGLSTDNLKNILSLGGIPVPSLGITDAKYSDVFNEFGGQNGVVLLFSKDTINPKNKSNEVYSRDVYSKTIPEIYQKVDKKLLNKTLEEFRPYEREYGTFNKHDFSKSSLNSIVNDLQYSDATKAKFLDDNNYQYEKVYRNYKSQYGFTEEVIDKFLREHSDLANFNPYSVDNTSEITELAPRIKEIALDMMAESEPKISRKQFEALFKDKWYLQDVIDFYHDIKGYQRLNGQKEFDSYATRDNINAVVEQHQEEYENWLRDKFKDVYGDKYFENDRGTKKDYTLENLTSYMKKGNTKAQQRGMFDTYGIGQAKGDSAKRYMSIEQIKLASEKLVDAETYKARHDAFEKIDEDVRTDIGNTRLSNGGDVFEVYSDYYMALGQTARGIDAETALRNNYFNNLSDEQIQKFKEVADALNNLPAKYFEAKPQRTVTLDEIKGIVVPNNIDTELKEQLLNNGYNLAEFDPSIEGDKTRVINQFENLKFSMNQQSAFTPETQGTRTTYGELFDRDIAPIREDLSNITEQMNNLSNQIETMQQSLENASKGYVETYNEQRNENIPTRNLTEADANTLQDALMQDEGYLRSLDEQANQTTNNTKLVDKLTNEVNRRLDLDRGQKETLRNIINDSIEKGYSADELSYALYKEFSEASYEMTNQEAVDARRLIRDMPIKVSDSIKTEIPDYGKWKQSNFGKINFSNRGGDVDSVYMELSERMPYYFPSDIINPTEQLLQIAEVANMATKTTETIDIDPDEFDDIADYILNTQLEDEYNAQMNSQYDLEKNIQFDMNEDIVPTTIRTQDSIEDYIENRDIAPVKPDKSQQRAENRLKRSNAWRSFREKITNRNAVIDDYSKATGNRQIKFAGDMLNSVSGEVQYNIYNRQTDINGKTIGKSINEIFEPSKKAGLYQVFNDYLFNKSNIERHRVGKGSQVPEAVSQQLVNQYEQQYPEVKKWAKDVYKYYDNVLQEQVNAGLITQEQYNNYRGENGIYRSYTPFYTDNIDSRYFDNEGKVKPVSTLKRSKGNASDVSQLLSMEDAMAKQTYAYKRAIRQNELFKEIVSASEKYSDAMDMDVRDNPTNLDDSLYTTPEGDKVVTAYINGEKVSAKISDELFNELSGDNEARIKQFEEDFSIVTNPLQRLSGVRRNLLTTWNPTFLARNAIKDIQDAVINSKHTAGMLKNYIPGIKELSSAKTQTSQQFLALYGADNLYGDYSNISKGKKAINKFVRLNELIELAPRFAEFKASLQAGDSVQEAIYNAREVTTNFGRGGYITKALNRNGFTFLNANVQGLSKLVRNLSGENGVKGVTSVVVKGALFAVAPSIINHLLYGLDDDKDEEYESIPDYIKDNYYLVKTEGNNFVRIPKGRINAVFGSLARRMIEAGEGEGFDFKEWGENAWNQIGVGDSSGIQTIFTPLRQAFGSKNGEAWYGGDIVPTRLQNKPVGEQTDAKIDAVSNFIGENLGISPYKINYVLDQYSGGIGDVLLPYITPETKNGAETFGEHLVAPIKDAFVVNSTDDNKYAGDFYNLKDKLEVQSNSEKATDDDKIKYKYMSEVSKKMGELYKEKREVQADTTLGNKAKYEKVQKIQNEINSLAKEGLSTYQSANTTENYSEIGDTEYYKNAKNEWTKVNEDEQEFTAGLNTAEKDSYFKAKNKIYGITQKYSNKLKGLDKDDPSKPQIYADKKEDITKAIVNSGLDNQMKAMVYSKYYSNQDTMTNVVNAGYDVDTYITALNDIDQLRTKYSKKNGYTTEERKQKTIAYINSLNMEIPQKAMMIRNYYTSFRQYNNDIVNYVANLDLSYEDKKAILEDTGMTVKGNSVSWK